MHRALNFLLAGLVWAIASGCSETAAKEWAAPKIVAHIATPLVTEASGLAVSRRAPDILWVNNDSGGEPVLYAIDTAGRLRGSVRVRGVTNYDWEDLASFELDGRSWLLIAETGDNNAVRHDCAIYIIPEPDPAALDPTRELTVSVEWQIPVRYPGGPRDCESVGVDVTAGKILLISKRTTPPAVYTLPLRASASTPEAEPIATLTGLTSPQGQQAIFDLPSGRMRAWPVALDISTDGTAAVVLTYGEPYLYTRQPGESWAKAFARPPVRLPAHHLSQAEDICFSPDGHSILVTTEGKNPPLLRYTRP